MELPYFLWCYTYQAVEQTAELPVILDGMTVMWYHCNAALNGLTLNRSQAIKFAETVILDDKLINTDLHLQGFNSFQQSALTLFCYYHSISLPECSHLVVLLLHTFIS